MYAIPQNKRKCHAREDAVANVCPRLKQDSGRYKRKLSQISIAGRKNLMCDQPLLRLFVHADFFPQHGFKDVNKLDAHLCIPKLKIWVEY